MGRSADNFTVVARNRCDKKSCFAIGIRIARAGVARWCFHPRWKRKVFIRFSARDMAQNGKIGVSTENIFPIIKKFLYSDHEIFLRELVANAVDATQKLRTLAKAGDFAGEAGDETIEIRLDREAKTLTISDKGIGMTAEEVEKYINQIALSGATSFLDKYKDAGAIIGHFGLGFYSAFMVSDEVEIDTLSWQEGAKPVRWSCKGDPEYTLAEGSRATRGTDVVLHISADNAEFLEKHRIQELLQKYCRFMAGPIAFGKKTAWKDGKEVETDEPNIVNDVAPIWTRKPAELKAEDYEKFYHALYPMAEEPLFHIHLNVDYPFNLTGVLYFPRLKSNFDIQRNKIQLYCNQVFVTDSVEGIVPEYLTLLHGVIDSPDIPLNVSRSYLQSDQRVKQIAGYITKKVADRLTELFKADRAQYEAKWDDLKLFITYGMGTDEKVYERAAEVAWLKNVDGKYFTFTEYRELVQGEQTDKAGDVVYLYTTDPEGQWSYVEAARAKGYDVLLMDGQLDAHLLGHLEQKLEKTRFMRVDANTVDRLIDKGDSAAVSLSEEAQGVLREVVEGAARGEERVSVRFEELGETALPAIMTRNEFMRRMQDMQAMSPTNPMFGSMPQSIDVVLNSSHPLVKRMWKEAEAGLSGEIKSSEAILKPLEEELQAINERTKGVEYDKVPAEDKKRREELYEAIDAAKKERRDKFAEYGKSNVLVGQVIDLALLSNNMLKGEALQRFVERSVAIVVGAQQK